MDYRIIQIFKEELTLNLHNVSQKIEVEESLPNSLFYEVSVTLIVKTDKDRKKKKENCRLTSLTNKQI